MTNKKASPPESKPTKRQRPKDGGSYRRLPNGALERIPDEPAVASPPVAPLSDAPHETQE